MIIGFNRGGWMLVTIAEEEASNQVDSALVSALAPICVDRFQSSLDNVANLAALDEQSSYKRMGYIEDTVGQYCQAMMKQQQVWPRRVHSC